AETNFEGYHATGTRNRQKLRRVAIMRGQLRLRKSSRSKLNKLSCESSTCASCSIEGTYGVGWGLQSGVVFDGECAVGDRSCGSRGDVLVASVPCGSFDFAEPRRGRGRGAGRFCPSSGTSAIACGSARYAGVAGSCGMESCHRSQTADTAGAV